MRPARLLSATLALAIVVMAASAGATASAASYKVLVAYADEFHSSPSTFPTPWAGSPNVIFEGCPGGPAACTNGGLDSSAVALYNQGTTALTVNSVVVTFGPTCVYDIWPRNVSLPPHEELILAETKGGAPEGCTIGTGQMDGSDIGPEGSSWASNCNQSGVIPTVAVTVNNVLKEFSDAGQVLNTGGVDALACGQPNESELWTPVGGKICRGLSITASPPSQHTAPSGTAVVKAVVKNGCGQTLVNEPVAFTVGSGPHAGATQTVDTNPSGTATYSDAGTGVQGLDAITASVSNPAGTVNASPVYVAFENAALTVIPTTGTSATSVTAQGSGFGSMEPVRLTWASPTGSVLKTVTSSTTGSFSTSFHPPATATAGTYFVFAVGQTSGNEGITPFTVTSPVAATTGIVTGTFYNTTTAGGFAPSGAALWSQPFASLAFNPDKNAPVSCSNATGVSENSRPFTNVTPLVDGTCAAVVAQNAEGTQQAGTGSLAQYDMTVTGSMTIPVAGNIVFDGFSDDGFVLGLGTDAAGDQPTYVSGSHNTGNLSATFLHGYPIAGADSGSHTPRDARFVVNFPSAGTYPFEIDYQEDGFAALQLVLQAEGKLIVAAAPTVTLTKASVAAGGSDGFNGSGFAAGETVNAYLDNTSGTLIGTGTASSGGGVSGSVTIPAGTAAGKHVIVFAGHATGASTRQVVNVS